MKQGYPQHAALVVGHLGEAADECANEYPDLAARIRAQRLAYMADPESKDVDLLGLAAEVQKVRSAARAASSGMGAVLPPSVYARAMGMGVIGEEPPLVQVEGIPRPIARPVLDGGSAYRIQIPTGSRGTLETLKVMGEMAIEASQEPVLIADARAVVRDCASKDHACEFQAILRWVKDVLTYRHDGTFQEMQQSPAYALYVSGDGDCFTNGTKVLLRDGVRLVDIESLRVGDEIWGHDRWSKVTATFDKGVRPTWRITLNNGGTVRLTPEHHVWRLRCPAHEIDCNCLPSERVEERVTVSELRPKDVVLTPDRIAFGSQSMDPGRAYIEGLYASDGYKKHKMSFSISGRDGFPREEQKRDVQSICQRLGVQTSWSDRAIAILDPDWSARMNACGTVAWEKRVLSLDLDESSAKQLLRGVMADSGFTTGGYGRYFSSSSETLWLQTRVLLKMFGVSCSSAYLAPGPKRGTSEHGMYRLGIRSTLSFLGKIYKKLWSARDEGVPRKGMQPEKILRIKSIAKDNLELPCFDITTDDHKVWLPEADWTTSQCNNASALVAALDLAIGATGVKFRAVALDPSNPEEYSHVYTMVLADGRWLAQDTVPNEARLGFEPPPRLWVRPPLDYVVVGPSS